MTKRQIITILRSLVEAETFAVVAKRAGVAREPLYRALSPTGNPSIDYLLKVADAVGCVIVVRGK